MRDARRVDRLDRARARIRRRSSANSRVPLPEQHWRDRDAELVDDALRRGTAATTLAPPRDQTSLPPAAASACSSAASAPVGDEPEGRFALAARAAPARGASRRTRRVERRVVAPPAVPGSSPQSLGRRRTCSAPSRRRRRSRCAASMTAVLSFTSPPSSAVRPPPRLERERPSRGAASRPRRAGPRRSGSAPAMKPSSDIVDPEPHLPMCSLSLQHTDAGPPELIGRLRPWSRKASPHPSSSSRATPARPFGSPTCAGKPVVLYFYPKDDTPGCTKQACGIRDAWDAFGERARSSSASAPTARSRTRSSGRSTVSRSRSSPIPTTSSTEQYGFWVREELLRQEVHGRRALDGRDRRRRERRAGLPPREAGRARHRSLQRCLHKSSS